MRSRVVREAALVLAFYYLYQTIRRLADTGNNKTRAYANAIRLVDLEKTLGIFTEHTIQRAFLPFRWLIKSMNIYYGTLHFIVTAGLLIWLFVRHHEVYRRMRNLLGATTALALIGYWTFPLAPPRLYSCNCFVDTLDTVGGLWSYHSSAAKAIANNYAAMPSLHFGWALWCAVVLFQFARHRVTRALCVLYPLLTLFAIVVTANHYWLDAVGGAVIFGGGLGVVRLIDKISLRRRTAAAAKA
ncbi:unnamed protein product [Phaeothamnion confervicola]